MAEAPTISVIIPTLNAARVLGRCLAAIRAQDHPRDRVEIVVADAGSTDATLDICREYGVDRIVPNPLTTGEAGKAAAIATATGDILALVDSDNILTDTGYFSAAARQFADPSVDAVEPLEWAVDPTDTVVNRYCALLGMNDPLSLFLGNYNRYSHLTRRFTGLPVRGITETPDAVVVDVDPRAVPTFGANGFMIRRTVLDGLDWTPYYFDIDVFQQAAAAGHGRVVLVRSAILHLYCDTARTFRRKQARRIRDFLHHARGQRRTYDYRAVPLWRYVWFVAATVTTVPLVWQAARGWLHHRDAAWWFHIPACWMTLVAYASGVVASLAGTGEYDRSTWKQ